MPTPSKTEFVDLVKAGAGGRAVVVPLSVRLLDDQMSPVLAYRRLVAPDERTAPSFLFESVEQGRQGRYSILGARPALEVVAYGHRVRVVDHRGVRRTGRQPRITESSEADPLGVPRRLTRELELVKHPGAPLPGCFVGGWVGFAGYDTVRYAEPEKLASPPRDDRGLPDLHFAYYDGVVVFDHVDKLVHVIRLIEVAPGARGDDGALGRLYDDAVSAVETRAEELQRHAKHLVSGRVTGSMSAPARPMDSNTTRQRHREMVARAKEYIAAGDVFQVVLGQRFERQSAADPFDVYRALRAVNPSPYMVYLQAAGCILVASSPEILCRVRRDASGRRIVVNRPLAGTRARGGGPEEDEARERELLGDPKERAEHIMLVDLGRNDVGRVAAPGTVELPRVMEVERYSHVMHISSTVTGELRPELDAWDALRATLPVGTISGAPKVRAMQIIDELEPVRRGPYGGGMGYVSLDGDMDVALALRTMVVPTGRGAGDGGEDAQSGEGGWMYHIQAAGGIVADSDPDAEFAETVNKAMALARAIDVAEAAFGGAPGQK